MRIKKIIIIFCIIFISFTFCNAEETTLQWDPSIDAPYIEGYRVYQTETKGEYILYSDVFDDWIPNTGYIIGDRVTELGVHYTCNTDHISSVCETWVPGTDYIVGNKVHMYAANYICDTAHISSICDAWTTNTNYVIDDRVSSSDGNYKCKIDHISSIFDAWTPCIGYAVGNNIHVSDISYKCNANHASSSCNVWTPNTDYTVGSRVSESGNYYICNADHTSFTSLWTYSLYDPELFTSWTDYRLTLTMRSDDDDAIGVMFRYQDNANYYRFSWDRERSCRRLVKQENGEFVVLAEDAVMYVPGKTYELEVVVNGSVLEIWIDGSQIFIVEDGSFSAGSIAFYSWANSGSYFDNVHVEELVAGTVLLSEDFNNGEFNGWNIVDEGNMDGQSVWSVESGMLVQSSNIYSTPTGVAELPKLGTFVLYVFLEGVLNWDSYTPVFSEDVAYWDVYTPVFMDDLPNWTYFPLFMDDIDNWTEISLIQNDIANWDVLSNNMVWTGPGLTCTLPVIYPTTYYVVTCYDTRKLESAESNEVFRVIQFLNISLTDMSEDNFDQCVDRRIVDNPFTVCWDMCENAINYELKIAHYFYAGLETDVVTTSETCYTFSNLPKSSRHFEIKVRAVYPDGLGDWGSSANEGSPKNWLIYSKPAGPS